jgi:hypothetical protein
MANTTWSTTDKSAGITLSNANLTATGTAAQSLRAIDRQALGKFYFELTMNTSNISTYVGLVCQNAALATSTVIDPSVMVNVNGTIFVNSLSTGIQLGVRASGDIFGIAVDLTNRLAWFRVAPSGNWNANAAYSPATGTGGVAFTGGIGLPMYPWAYFNTAGNIVANFGGSAFTGAVPAGFTSGFTAGAVIGTNELATQVAAEQWASMIPPQMRATQAAIEQWASTTTATTQMLLTQAAIEQWTSTATATTQMLLTQAAIEQWSPVTSAVTAVTRQAALTVVT